MDEAAVARCVTYLKQHDLSIRAARVKAELDGWYEVPVSVWFDAWLWVKFRRRL